MNSWASLGGCKSECLCVLHNDSWGGDYKQRCVLQDGWGIATDGASLIISDSGPTLYWLDAKTLKEHRRVDVHDATRKVPWVNEVRCCWITKSEHGLDCIWLMRSGRFGGRHRVADTSCARPLAVQFLAGFTSYVQASHPMSPTKHLSMCISRTVAAFALLQKV